MPPSGFTVDCKTVSTVTLDDGIICQNIYIIEGDRQRFHLPDESPDGRREFKNHVTKSLG
jgi:hypothetical protein